MARILRCATAVLAPFFAIPVLAQPVVVVHDFGEAPREEIRYAFAPDATAQATMTMRMQMSMGGQQMPGMSIPAISIPMTVRTTEVRGDGTARLEFETAAPSVEGGGEGNPALSQALASSIGQIGNLTGWYRMDARGNILESIYDVPAGVVPPEAGQMMNQMQGQMQQFSAPFPAEAVGVGARWQTTTSAVLMGAPLSMTTEYTLVARNGDIVELGMKVVETVTAPGAASPGVPPEAQGAMGAMKATGAGTMTIDLNKLVAKSEMTTSTSMSMAMPTQGQAQNMSMAMQMTMSIQPD